MRIGFHYHIPAVERYGKIWMPGYLGLFIDSLAAKAASVTCFQHSPPFDRISEMDYAIKSPRVSLVDIGPHTSIPIRTLKAFAGRHLYRKWENELDVMLVRASTPLLPVLASIWRKPLALLIVSDAVVGIDNLPQPHWRKELIRVWAKWNQHQQMYVARRSLTFVNSRLLHDQMNGKVPNLIETRTTTLKKDDFF